MNAKIAILAVDDGEVERLEHFAPDSVSLFWVDSGLPADQQAAQVGDAAVTFGITTVEVARHCDNLKLVQVPSAGTERLDVKTLGEMGIRVANCGGGNAVAVSEHTIALMLSVYRKLHLQFQAVEARRWGGDVRANWFPHAHELTGKTVGIVGLGRIGQQVARRLAGWDCTLLYHDMIERPADLEKELGVERVTLDRLLKESDVVTLHVPLTNGTRGIIGERELDLMKPTAVLINTCRGPVVREAALVRALQTDKIAGAGLDVLEQEPTPADNPLLDMDSVAITPHMASFAQESWHKSRQFAIENAARVALGGEPESVVLPE